MASPALGNIHSYVVAVMVAASMQIVTYAQAPDNSGCDCSPDHLYTRFLAAEQVFFGEIDSARLDEDTQQVHFNVVVLETFLGQPSATTELTTPLPSDCGLEIRAGMETTFVLRSDSQQVTQCDYQLDNRPFSPELFRLAVALVNSSRFNRQTNLSLISDYLGTGAYRGSIETILSLAHRLDPAARYSATDDYIQFKDVTVTFKGNRVLNYERL